jgi:hypothetical protein
MTTLVLVTTVIFLFISGFPVTYGLLHRNEILKTSLYAISPIVGFFILTTVIKILIGFNVTIDAFSYSLVIVSLVQFGLFSVVVHKKSIQLPRINKAFLIGAMLTILSCSLGYILGGDDTQGFIRWDMARYTSHAQVFRQFELGMTHEQLSHFPWAMWLSGDVHRLTVTTMIGFFSSILRIDTAMVTGFYGPLSAWFVYLTMLLLGQECKLSKYSTLSLAILAATIPAISTLYTEGFIAAGMAVPFMILGCLIFAGFMKNPSWGTLIISALLISTVSTTYTEMLIPLLGIYFIIFIFQLVLDGIDIKKIYMYILPVIVSFLLNFQYLRSVYHLEIFRTLQRDLLGGNTDLDVIYPYALSAIGIQRNFWGLVWNLPVLGIISTLLVIVSFYGLIQYFLKKKSIPIAACIALCSVMFVFCSKQTVQIYQFYRVFTMFTPVLIVGLWFFGIQLLDFIQEGEFTGILNSKKAKRFFEVIIMGTAVLMMINSCLFTIYSHNVAYSKTGLPDRKHDSIPYYQPYNQLIITNSGKIEYLKALDTIGKNPGKRFVFSGQEVHVSYLALLYKAKDEAVYLMQKDLDSVYTYEENNKYKYLIDNLNTSDLANVVIINLPIAFGYKNLEEKETRVDPTSEETKITYSLETKEGRKSFANVTGNFARKLESKYLLRILSLEKKTVQFAINFTSEASDAAPSIIHVKFNEQFTPVVRNADGTYSVSNLNIRLGKGLSTHNLEFTYFDAKKERIDIKVKPVTTYIKVIN